jgi:hypothetical protein
LTPSSTQLLIFRTLLSVLVLAFDGPFPAECGGIDRLFRSLDMGRKGGTNFQCPAPCWSPGLGSAIVTLINAAFTVPREAASIFESGTVVSTTYVSLTLSLRGSKHLELRLLITSYSRANTGYLFRLPCRFQPSQSASSIYS